MARQPSLASLAKAGGAERDRTADLVIANDALSQLSYGPVSSMLVRKPGMTRVLGAGLLSLSGAEVKDWADGAAAKRGRKPKAAIKPYRAGFCP